MDPVAPITTATERLLQAGLLGVFVVVFGLVIYALWRESKEERQAFMKQLDDLHKARVDDTKAAQAQMVSVIQQCTQALTTTSSTMESQKEATVELRNTLREFGDELRTFGDDLRNRPRRG
jgi:hypothetical protein